MLGYESWQQKRLRRVERRITLARMAQRVTVFRSVISEGSQDRRSAGHVFMDGYSRDERICVALSQEPLIFAAEQLGIQLPKDSCTMSHDSNDRVLSSFEEWMLRREIRKQRWKRVFSWSSLVTPVVSAIISRGCSERRLQVRDGLSRTTDGGFR